MSATLQRITLADTQRAWSLLRSGWWAMRHLVLAKCRAWAVAQVVQLQRIKAGRTVRMHAGRRAPGHSI